jgi:glycosyltransferase involved in cell wall biosynthesis
MSCQDGIDPFLNPMIPKVVHFVFGLEEQREPFHFVHYLSVESCRRQLAPDAIYFHCKHVPWGPWWERVEPHVRVLEVDLAPEVSAADYSLGAVPPSYRYAHHADFVRLDALIEHGGIYADIDTVFVRPFRPDLFDRPFVIGAEPPVRDERTGESRPSLCNAVLMGEPGSIFARTWRDRMADALDGTWSNHSGFLSRALSDEMPDAVHIEPATTFFSFPADPLGLSKLFEERHRVPLTALSVHLWAHLWWKRGRRDFSRAHAGWCTPSAIRRARTTFADLARPYLDQRDDGPSGLGASPDTAAGANWIYLSLDETSGYGVAADRCRTALEDSGMEVDWTPFVPGGEWNLGYQPPPALDPFGPPGLGPGQVVVAHLVPEFLPAVRRRCPEAFLVGHTAWETDRIPDHWIGCLDAADLVVVPSSFSAQAIASSPVSAPVAVVPHVAPEEAPLASSLWDGIPPDVFVCYTIAEWSERKAVFHSIEAYLRAFTTADRVLLVVKTSHHDRRRPLPSGRRAVEPGTSAWALARLLARHRDPAPVQLVTRELSDDDVGALHRRGNCFVSLCRSEGWGLGAFDAAASGNPVVTTGFGGHLDYLAGSPYLVRFDLAPVHDPAGYPSYVPDQHWAEPDLDHGAELLRHVVAHRDDAAARAASLGRELRWRYRPAAVAATFRAAVESRSVGSGVPGQRARTRIRGQSPP